MRVLWFSSSSGNLNTINTFNRLGWIASLENAVNKYENIDLAIAFISDNPHFSINNKVTYYGIEAIKNSKAKRLLERYFNKIEGKEYIEKFRKIINDFKPDIIHVHGTENPFGYIINKINIPTIISIQGNISVITKKYFSGISIKAIIKKTKLFDFVFKIDDLSLYHKFLKMRSREQEILANAKYIIGRTEWDKRITRVLAPKSIYYFGGEVLRDVFYNEKWIPKKSREIFNIISVIGPYIYKGLETILQSARLLMDLGFSFSWKIAGVNNTDRLISIVEGEIGSRFYKNNIELLGSIAENDIVKELLSSDLFVSCSHIENSPNNVCEAMLLGLPIIASFAGGTGSLLQDKKEGILIQDGDPWSLAGTILELARNYNQAIELGNNARTVALERHNPLTVARQITNAYRNILVLDEKAL